ncbi:MAG: hypothetical protein WKF84_28495 [Pyrinomonadaceae bacterium]
MATIGHGIIGTIDTATALRVPGVELVAVADVYEGRFTRAKELYPQQQIATTRDYREVLSSYGCGRRYYCDAGSLACADGH